MSYSFIKFNDEIVDSKIMMELTDLARLLMKKREVTVSVRKYSYYDPVENTFNLSFFWKHRTDITEREGFRYDLLTRYPSAFINDYSQYGSMKGKGVLAQQIFLSLEYYRNRRAAFNSRPLISSFVEKGDAIRVREYSRNAASDAEAFIRSFNIAILERSESMHAFDADFPLVSTSTKDSIRMTSDIISTLSPRISLNTTFQIHDMPFNEISAFNKTTPFRKDAASLEEHIENEEEATHSVDTKTDRDAEDANVLGETGDNASRKSAHGRQNDHNDDVSDYYEGFGRNAGDNQFEDRGRINQHATLNVLRPKIKLSQYKDYQNIYESYNYVAQKVIGDITQILNYKMNAYQTRRTSGKLMKNPVGPLMENSHKLFVKKNTESKEIDAVFTIIIDQSFSMTEHLAGCRNGAIILNNILRSLHIPHRIISYHEDTFEVMKNHYPNNIYEHMDFDRSRYYYPVSLMDLEASGDNRDGLIIRNEMENLVQRSEKDKFIIMFSDGLPSAEQYNQSGIIDTHEAVQEARRSGIQVINMFIDQDNEENTLTAIRNIYDTDTVIVHSAEEIAFALPNLLKRVLTKVLM
ncbi:VWA domain-containing protein [Salinicoccus cyprini]|uniref:VWA domain-containing protein n=1 Tax=Salinicoccus cyprini TaxID=2493691 RepID=A0A558AZ90_9STAP|nr:VWA domain-containing protein [Salinicoccus cyprini]TVT29589.1 VWA domain-containing protein [Salinicoccus cyprini]